MPSDHLDDAALSAHLDGDALGPHLDECAACADRLAVLRAVRDLVAAPVDPPPGAIDAAVAAALAARVVPLEPRRRNLAAVLAVAAVLAALLVAVPLLAGLGGDDDATDTAAGPATLEAATPPDALADLGALDEDRLREVLAVRLGTRQAAEGDAFAGGTGAGAAAGSGAADEGTTDATTAGPGGEELAPTPVGGGATGGPAAGGEVDCLPSLARPDEPVLRGTGTWDGTPVEVIAFDEGEAIVAYVLDRTDCRIIHFARI